MLGADGTPLSYNLYVYCDNNPVNKVDYTGEDGKNFQLTGEWYYRIDAAKAGRGSKRHIHIWNKRVSYAINDDGSPHEPNKNKQGPLPSWLQDMVKEKTGWDYNGLRDSFFSKTVTQYSRYGVTYIYADGTSAYRSYNSYTVIRPNSISTFEAMYGRGGQSGYWNSGSTIFFIPFFGRSIFQFFGFNINWGFSPVPMY